MKCRNCGNNKYELYQINPAICMDCYKKKDVNLSPFDSIPIDTFSSLPSDDNITLNIDSMDNSFSDTSSTDIGGGGDFGGAGSSGDW
jgi:uncharacterized membrane protein YgcG